MIGGSHVDGSKWQKWVYIMPGLSIMVDQFNPTNDKTAYHNSVQLHKNMM